MSNPEGPFPQVSAAQARRAMLEEQIIARRVRDGAVLRALGHVPREAFVPEQIRSEAYTDRPLPIGNGQTISQPYIVARMAEALALKLDDRVLEIGTGSGYGAAVLGSIAENVVSIERDVELASAASERLARLGFDNITVERADGSLGWADRAPYDAICVTATAPGVPAALLEQLADGGRLVLPIGHPRHGQELIRIRRSDRGSSPPSRRHLARWRSPAHG